jgi:hypothetical protein
LGSFASTLEVAVAEQDSPAEGHAANSEDGHTSRAEGGTNGASQIFIAEIRTASVVEAVEIMADLNFGEGQFESELTESVELLRVGLSACGDAVQFC